LALDRRHLQEVAYCRNLLLIFRQFCASVLPAGAFLFREAIPFASLCLSFERLKG
jgi:hypothetical protein